MDKLVMTLLVRDEEDILERNICFHLNQGVDHIIVTDNGSVDGTQEILEKYSKKGVLSYTVCPDHTFEQHIWVSRMAQSGVDEFGATHLFHCDADEFWLPRPGMNLKNVIGKIDSVVGVRLINYLPPEGLGKRKFDFRDFTKIVANPIPYPSSYHMCESSKILLYEYPRKIISTKNYTTVGYGNHCVGSIKPEEIKSIDSVTIQHFSIRSFQHFKNKVINGGMAMSNNPNKDKEICWHWKRWYQLYKIGKLEDEYKKLCLEDDASEYVRKGVVKVSPVPVRIKFGQEIFKLKELLH